VDELPLEWFFSDGVVLDMTAKADGEKVEASDVEAALAGIGYELKPLDIVLVRTGRDTFYGRPDYVWRGCAVTPGATRWLFERGVRVMGIDAWGWDGPLDRQAREALARGEPGVFWAAHQCDLPYSQIERLVNLGALPPFGFRVACFPLRIQGGSAGPTRAVAILPD
jgi:kynurenine formamidase